MHTVLSAFDTPAAAQRTLDLLALEGFPRHNMHIEVNANPDAYSDAVRRGGAVLVVDTSSEITAERAATVMNESGACGIERQA